MYALPMNMTTLVILFTFNSLDQYCAHSENTTSHLFLHGLAQLPPQICIFILSPSASHPPNHLSLVNLKVVSKSINHTFMDSNIVKCSSEIM